MVIEIDFNSDEAIYVQLMNQIILVNRHLKTEGRRCSAVGKAAGGYYRDQYAYSE